MAERKGTVESLSKTFLDENIGEEAGQLLDDLHVYLGAEGDVQEKKFRTSLKEFLQRGSTHQPCACLRRTTVKGEKTLKRLCYRVEIKL